MTEPTQPSPASDEPTEEMAAKIFDYYEGTLPAAERPAIEAYLSARGEPLDPIGTREALSGLRKQAAPTTFTGDVTSTINKRSAGRFFGKKEIGDRVPFGWILIVALIILLGVAALLWSSSTGSLRVRRDHAPPTGSATPLAPAP